MTALLRNGKKAEAVNLYGRISKAQVKASPDPLSPNRNRDPNPKPGPNPSAGEGGPRWRVLQSTGLRERGRLLGFGHRGRARSAS